MSALATLGLVGLAIVIIVLVVAAPNLIRSLKEQSLLSRRLRVIDLYAQSPDGFEGLIERIFSQHGYKTLAKSRGLGHSDGGVDLKLRAPDGKIVLVQCKNWLTWRVGVEPVRALYGVVAKAGADEGVVVTSGSFSGAARRWAGSIPANRQALKLLDGKEVLRWAASTKPAASPTLLQRAQHLADRMDRYMPFGPFLDWTDAQFQNRPIWVPAAAALMIGGAFIILRQPLLAVAYTALILVVGGFSHGWRWWQGRLLHRIMAVQDLRHSVTRGRLQYVVAEACQRQGYFVREFKPKGVDLYCLEARAGKERTLIQVLPREASRVSIGEVQALEQLRARHQFHDAVLVTAGIVPSETLSYAASTNVQTLSGRELVEFLSAVRRQSALESIPPYGHAAKESRR